jgi:AAA+ ATPase superfamily predicted ATPase
MSGKASLLPLSEELYLRSLTGRLVGEHLFDGYRRVAAIAYPDRVCAAMAAAAVTSYTYYAGYRDGLAAVFAYDEKIDETARAIASADFDIVYVAFGGEQKLSTVNEATVKTLKALANAGYRRALAVHVRAWLATKQLSTVLSDPSLRQWLESLPEVRVFTADLNSKKFIFNRVKFTEGKASLTPYREASLTDEHVDLLKRSIPPPE